MTTPPAETFPTPSTASELLSLTAWWLTPERFKFGGGAWSFSDTENRCTCACLIGALSACLNGGLIHPDEPLYHLRDSPIGLEAIERLHLAAGGSLKASFTGRIADLTRFNDLNGFSEVEALLRKTLRASGEANAPINHFER